MTADAELPELVQDSQLQVTFCPNEHAPNEIRHKRPSGRGKPQKEIWVRQRNLGGGGYGIVWLEKAQSGGRLRAVKEMRMKGKGVKDGPVRELEAIAKFSQDKFVDFFVKSHGWFESSESLFIAMEYCEHGDLKHHLMNHGKLPEDQVQEISWQILQGLVFMHASGFAHRDLKPANILIKSKPPDNDWHVKICDLGLSKRIVGDSDSSTMRGTPGFLPPEIIVPRDQENSRNKNPFPRDIWCLGQTIFTMLTRKATFENNLPQLMDYARGGIPFPEQPLRECQASDTAISFIQFLMAPHPNDRPEAKAAQEHPWMTDAFEIQSDSSTVEPLIDRFSSARGQTETIPHARSSCPHSKAGHRQCAYCSHSKHHSSTRSMPEPVSIVEGRTRNPRSPDHNERRNRSPLLLNTSLGGFTQLANGQIVDQQRAIELDSKLGPNQRRAQMSDSATKLKGVSQVYAHPQDSDILERARPRRRREQPTLLPIEPYPVRPDQNRVVLAARDNVPRQGTFKRNTSRTLQPQTNNYLSPTFTNEGPFYRRRTPPPYREPFTNTQGIQPSSLSYTDPSQQMGLPGQLRVRTDHSFGQTPQQKEGRVPPESATYTPNDQNEASGEWTVTGPLRNMDLDPLPHQDSSKSGSYTKDTSMPYWQKAFQRLLESHEAPSPNASVSATNALRDTDNTISYSTPVKLIQNKPFFPMDMSKSEELESKSSYYQSPAVVETAWGPCPYSIIHTNQKGKMTFKGIYMAYLAGNDIHSNGPVQLTCQTFTQINRDHVDIRDLISAKEDFVAGAFNVYICRQLGEEEVRSYVESPSSAELPARRRRSLPSLPGYGYF